ncbi:MAG: hypothetical protein IJV98_02180 [Clostridia bacterium]|nr:hypothetical protein [Clostridia bacterium]
MRYVFFDIECADGGKGSICSFGYVVCDESFQEIESDDIVINPNTRFCLGRRTGRAELVLAYTEAEFRRAPIFPRFYDRIRKLLEAPDQLVIGHSVQDDVSFLCKSCIRYGLDSLRFRFTDSQSLYAAYVGVKGQVGLDKACDALGITEGRDVHKSEEDARMAMRLVRTLCERTGKSLTELVASCTCGGITEDFKIFCSYIHPNRTMFLNYLDKVTPSRSGVLRGKRVAVATAIEQPNSKEIYHLVRLIYEAGGTYTRIPTQCDVFVMSAAESAKICKRTRMAKQARHGGVKIDMISYDALLTMLGITADQLAAMPDVDITWM